MARVEHDRWCRDMRAAGYVHGPEKVDDGDRKEHPDLIPWHRLSDEDKEKDRNTVRGIPQILDRVGFAVAEKGR
jgi:hypothetical protein